MTPSQLPTNTRINRRGVPVPSRLLIVGAHHAHCITIVSLTHREIARATAHNIKASPQVWHTPTVDVVHAPRARTHTSIAPSSTLQRSMRVLVDALTTNSDLAPKVGAFAEPAAPRV